MCHFSLIKQRPQLIFQQWGDYRDRAIEVDAPARVRDGMETTQANNFHGHQ